MAYTEERLKRIIELIKEMESRKEHKYAAATYRDVPALRELDSIVKEQLDSEHPHTLGTLTDSIFAVRYLGNAYESMWRIPYANKHYKWLLELHGELYRLFGEKDDECSDDYYGALRARNYHADDSCPDLAELAKAFLPDKKRLDIEKRVLVDSRPLRHDPVELTDEYLAVIDEVDRRMDTEDCKKVHPFVRNQIFCDLLREYGIEWEPLTSLNPGMHFD